MSNATLMDLDLKHQYRTNPLEPEGVVGDFYIPVLSVAKSYDRLSGFFSSASFIGKFSRNIPDELRDRFCGQITEISINGEVNALCPKWINVASKFEHSVKPGLVQFTPTVFLNLLRAEPCKYRLGIWRIKNTRNITIIN